jgi:Cu/Ag efflux protein CusF
VKKIIVVLTAAALVVCLVSLAFAAATQMGTIKSVDVKAGTVVFCAEGGKEVTLKADKSIDLDKIKAGDKVEISVEDSTLKSVKPGHVSWCPEGY